MPERYNYLDPIQTRETRTILEDVELTLWQPGFEASTIPELESQVFQTAPYLLEPGRIERWTDYLFRSDHRLLPDDAPDNKQRWFAMDCANSLRAQVENRYRLSSNPAASGKVQPYTPEDVIQYYQWFKQTDPVDYTLGHIFAGVKRLTQYAYHHRDGGQRVRDWYDNHLRLYRLMEQAIALDTGPGPIPPGQPPSTR
jgi:hypothetical protein